MDKLIKCLHYDGKESSIYMPNEIFKDLKSVKLKGSSHVAFAYSFYYLISWLYRYAKYGQINIDIKMIKEILGYNPNNKDVNYIIKKNGVLDEVGYSFSTTDYPISWDFNKGDIEFMLLSDVEPELKSYISNRNGRNYKIKCPVRGLYRSTESEDDSYLDGTFYDISNTHLVPFDYFIKCMSTEGLGVIGFYLYGFFRDKHQKHGEYKSSIERISNDTSIALNTCDRYISRLVAEGLISYKEGDCMLFEGKHKKEANTYKINENVKGKVLG